MIVSSSYKPTQKRSTNKPFSHVHREKLRGQQIAIMGCKGEDSGTIDEDLIVPQVHEMDGIRSR